MIKLRGVSVTTVETTSRKNLYDIFDMIYFNSLSDKFRLGLVGFFFFFVIMKPPYIVQVTFSDSWVLIFSVGT